MNYKLKIHFLIDVTTWRAHVPTLIIMDIIKSPFLHQCRLHSNGNGFKIVQKSFIQSSSNLQEANYLGFSCQHKVHTQAGLSDSNASTNLPTRGPTTFLFVVQLYGPPYL